MTCGPGNMLHATCVMWIDRSHGGADLWHWPARVGSLFDVGSWG